jgi:Protein of unknown function (DUF742)
MRREENRPLPRPAHAAPDDEDTDMGTGADPVDSGGVPPRRGHDWLDREAGALVRPYAVTGGRVRPAVHRLDLVDYVVAVPSGTAELVYLQPEHLDILAATQDPISVAEVAATLDTPLGDLVRQGLIAVRGQQFNADRSDDDLLKAVIDGLRSL